jgi:hypothetical protein
MRSEIYFSIDIESDGPIPGPHSMLSLGAVAFHENGTVLGSFSVNFELLEGATGHPETMAWWATQDPEIWAAGRVDPKSPETAMRHFSQWVAVVCAQNKGKPVCVAYPAGFDFTFVHWYFMRFTEVNPFSFACIDIKSYAMAVLGTSFRQTTKSEMPKAWFEGLPPHTHRAVDDALEQGQLFMAMRAHRASQQ